MKVPLGKIVSSVRSSAAKVAAKGVELKDAVVPVLTGPGKPAPTFYYCADGSTVLGPLAPDALYELVWRHESIPQDVPVSLAGTDEWVPFLALEESLFSKKLIQEVTKERAQRAAEQIRLAAEAERARVAEAKRLAALEQRQRAIRRLKLVFTSILLGFACFIALVIGLVNYTPPGRSSYTSAPSYGAEPRVSGGERSHRSETAPDTSRESVYVEGHWVQGHMRQLPAGQHPVSPTPSSNGGTEWVNGYTRKDGTYVQGHARKK